jgi:hypothetical protein
MLSTLIQLLGIVTIVLSMVLTVLFFKVYQLQRSVIVLGLPIGFMFLTISFCFLGVHLIFYTVINTFSSSLMWLRVATQTAGFALIASSYYLSGRSQNPPKHNLLPIALWSIVLVLCGFGFLLAINPAGLASIYTNNELFTIVNLALLSYIIFFIIKKLEATTEVISGLISTPVAFSFIWLGQFLFLIWKLDGGAGQAALIGSQITPIIGLILLIRLYYLINKRCYQVLDG